MLIPGLRPGYAEMKRAVEEALVIWPPVAFASLALLWIVPEFPLAHLDDPSHWGVLAYLLFASLLVGRQLRGAVGLPRRLLALFLSGMPLIYLANWLRHGGAPGWLGVELAGLGLFAAIAWLGWRGKAWWVVAGLAAHAVWDAAHLEGVAFVPHWYAIGCAVVDIGLSGYAAAVCLRSSPSAGGP